MATLGQIRYYTRTHQILSEIGTIFAIHLASIKQKILSKEQANLIKGLSQISTSMSSLLDESEVKNIKKIAYNLAKVKNILYIGRSVSQVTALEASLKFRELTYLNAQGISAGELKHGTIAVVDKKMPVIVIACHNSKSELFDKTISNAQEVNARGGKIILLSSQKGLNKFNDCKYKIEIPEVNNIIQEALMPIIPMQLLAYFVALFKGHDVDQPRNLAKSVTVE